MCCGGDPHRHTPQMHTYMPPLSLACRALIFAPPDTPYAYGAFAFDILLPPEYPSRPPLVSLVCRRRSSPVFCLFHM